MKTKSNTLFNAIDEILWKDWDPIGVNHYASARNEYTSYVAKIVKLKLGGADVQKVAKHLYKIETTSMWMTGNIDRCTEVALKIEEKLKMF